MANYCVKCGKELPEGADTCPVCNSAGQESDAALFTQITAATEAWKKTAEPKEKPKRTPQQKQLLAYSLGAAAFLLIAVLAILYIQPVNRVIRAINAGHYSQAKEIYWSDRGLVSGRHDEEINRALLRAAEKLTNEYADGKISGDDAARALATLGSIGTQAESLLSDSFAEFRTFNDSRDHLAEAEKLSLNGDYLGARDEYLRVLEGDANYAAAMESADASLEYYAESVLSSADLLIQSGDYGAAISAMEEAERKLLDYEVYNEKLDYKLTATYGLYEEELLSKASALAAQQEYSEAAKLLQQGMSDYDYSTDALTAAVKSMSRYPARRSLRIPWRRRKRCTPTGMPRGLSPCWTQPSATRRSRRKQRRRKSPRWRSASPLTQSQRRGPPLPGTGTACPERSPC